MASTIKIPDCWLQYWLVRNCVLYMRVYRSQKFPRLVYKFQKIPVTKCPLYIIHPFVWV